MYVELAVLALFVFCYSLVAGRVDRMAMSGPIIFVFAGFLMGPLGFGPPPDARRSLKSNREGPHSCPSAQS